MPPQSPLLVDLGNLCECHTDRALEEFYKASSEPPDDEDTFTPHESKFIRRLIELFTQRGMARVAMFFKELSKWLDRGKPTSATAAGIAAAKKPGARPPPDPVRMMQRWSAGEIEYVKEYLESLPPAQFTFSDWALVVDYLVQRYLPPDALRTESDWLSTRSTLMGRVQSNLRSITEASADKVLAAMPDTVAAAEASFPLTVTERAIMEFARERCAAHVTSVSWALRSKIKDLIIRHQQGVMLGDKLETAHALQTKLLDAMGTMNRDWRRIAVTEAGENANQGLVASRPVGSTLKRMEQYKGACQFCRSIDGKTFEVVSPDDPDKDGLTEVWVGKTNVGRSASPRKRVGGTLIEREPDERWWPAAGVQHPHCRGRWAVVDAPEPGDDPEFAKWLAEHLK